MSILTDYLKTHPTVYITLDIERALGLPLDTEGYFIISNSTPLAKTLAGGRGNVLLIESERLLSTRELLQHPLAISMINTLTNPSTVVFKTNALIERITARSKWHLLNPPAEVAKEAEEKISQSEWLGKHLSYLPPHNIRLCRDVDWRNEPFILQFNHSHTGQGTSLIETPEDLQNIASLYPNRPARCAELIPGPIFTNNNVVAGDRVLMGNISYQITGLAPFTDNPFATIGNDWALPANLLTEDQRRVYAQIVTDVASRFIEDGWQGLFGVDIVVDERNGKLYLLEINARQPASTTFESHLQQTQRENGAPGITTFEAHMCALHDLPITEDLIEISDGAQITQRVTKYKKKIENGRRQRVQTNGYRVIDYDNAKIGKELMRIQSHEGFMADHNILNDLGRELV